MSPWREERYRKQHFTVKFLGARNNSHERFAATTLRVIAVAMILLMTSCGGTALPEKTAVTANVTPAQATVKVNSTIGLQGQGTGFTDQKSVGAVWSMQESHGSLVTHNYCGDADTIPVPSFVDCPMGYVAYSTARGLPVTATYYAPPTPGTYHPEMLLCQNSGYDMVCQQATAAITVTN